MHSAAMLDPFAEDVARSLSTGALAAPTTVRLEFVESPFAAQLVLDAPRTVFRLPSASS